MEVIQGYSYHIKDEFFDMIQDKFLMSNREGGNYRPHFVAIRDRKNKELYWMIPISSQVEKYKTIIAKKINQYGKCNTIIIGTFAGLPNGKAIVRNGVVEDAFTLAILEVMYSNILNIVVKPE